MNLNELAREVSEVEGKKVQVNIAQIKEVLKCLGVILAALSVGDALRVVARLVDRTR